MAIPDWKKPKRSELIAKYTDKPVTRYTQFDGFIDAKEDSVMHPDEDGDVLMAGATYELMRFDDGVRVLIPDGIEPAAAARSLAKIADFVERDLADMRRRRDGDNSGTGSDIPF